VDADTANERVENPAPEREAGLKESDTPVGAPLAVNVTGDLKPLTTDSVTET